MRSGEAGRIQRNSMIGDPWSAFFEYCCDYFARKGCRLLIRLERAKERSIAVPYRETRICEESASELRDSIVCGELSVL